MDPRQDFISQEKRAYKIQLGHTLASALTGFVAGVISASIIFGTILYLTGQYMLK
jgi:acid phosphatase family membrane protein YuiD